MSRRILVIFDTLKSKNKWYSIIISMRRILLNFVKLIFELFINHSMRNRDLTEISFFRWEDNFKSPPKYDILTSLAGKFEIRKGDILKSLLLSCEPGRRTKISLLRWEDLLNLKFRCIYQTFINCPNPIDDRCSPFWTLCIFQGHYSYGNRGY